MTYWKDGNTPKICMNPPSNISVVLFTPNWTNWSNYFFDRTVVAIIKNKNFH